MNYGPLPTVEQMNGRGHAYYWARGGTYFNRPIIVEVNNGVRSEKDATGKRVFVPELNFTFPPGSNMPRTIWSSELKHWGAMLEMEWAGPIPEPVSNHKSQIPEP